MWGVIGVSVVVLLLIGTLVTLSIRRCVLKRRTRELVEMQQFPFNSVQERVTSPERTLRRHVYERRGDYNPLHEPTLQKPILHGDQPSTSRASYPPLLGHGSSFSNSSIGGQCSRPVSMYSEDVSADLEFNGLELSGLEVVEDVTEPEDNAQPRY